MVFVVAEVLMGALLPSSVAIGSVSPASIAIVVTWLAGIAVVNHVRRSPAWKVEAPAREAGPAASARSPTRSEPKQPTGSIRRAIVVFAFAALVTLGAGVLLEVAGATLADAGERERRDLRRDGARVRDGAARDQLRYRRGPARRPPARGR